MVLSQVAVVVEEKADKVEKAVAEDMVVLVDATEVSAGTPKEFVTTMVVKEEKVVLEDEEHGD